MPCPDYMCTNSAGDCYDCPPGWDGPGGPWGGHPNNPGCFVKGTLITMTDGTQKKIEDLDQDEKILSYNLETGKVEEDVILEIQTPFRDQFVTINGEHGKNKNTFDHPYWSVSKNKWVSYAPGETEENYSLNDVWELEEGEILLYLNDDGELIQSKVESIVVEDLQNTQTYNLSHVKNNNNFFANGYLVHNKDGDGEDVPRTQQYQQKPTSTGLTKDGRQRCPNGRRMIDGNCEGDYNEISFYDHKGYNGGNGNQPMDEIACCTQSNGTCTTICDGGVILAHTCNCNSGAVPCNPPTGACYHNTSCTCDCTADCGGNNDWWQPGQNPIGPSNARDVTYQEKARRGGRIRRRGGRIRRR